MTTTTAADLPGRPWWWAPRGVVWTGIAVGTALIADAYLQGAHPHLFPGWAGYLTAAALLWVLTIAALVGVIEAARRHHRPLGAAAGRYTRRGAGYAAQAARARGGTAWGRLTTRAAQRWDGREPGPLIFRRLRGVAAAGTLPPAEADGAPPPAAVDGGPSQPSGETVMATDTTGVPPQGPPLATAVTGWGQPDAAAARRQRAVHRAAVPAEWRAVAASAHDFVPETDEELLNWMAAQTAGLLAYAEAVTDAHDNALHGARLDPAALHAMHDAADAAAEVATAWAYARQKFADVYSGPREFVADGGTLPKDGDFITGEGDA
jgi:hypothetical protein